MQQNPLTINIYPGPDSTYQLYQDDGISFDAAGSGRLPTHRDQPPGHHRRAERPRPTSARTTTRRREPFYYVALLGTRHPSSVTLGGPVLTDVGNPATLAAAGASAYYWNQSIEITFVKIFDTSADVMLTALYF